METVPTSSTVLVIEEAKRRGIRVVSFPDIDEEFAVLEFRDHQEFIFRSATDRLGRVAYRILLNKMLTTRMLGEAGFPVPKDILTGDVEEAIGFLKKHSWIVVKPVNLTWGVGVTPGITTEDETRRAFAEAQQGDSEAKVICQQHVEGKEYRVLVIDYNNIFVVRRMSAHVVGDGRRTVKELCEESNQRTAEEYRITLTADTETLLADQDLRVDSVPAVGEHVRLKRVVNIHAGGTVEDATEDIGDEARGLAEAIARYFETPVMGIDVITSDIGTNLGSVIEVNAVPDLRIHSHPTRGKARNPAVAIIDMLFPETQK